MKVIGHVRILRENLKIVIISEKEKNSYKIRFNLVTF